jgi:hypothetical protein
MVFLFVLTLDKGRRVAKGKDNWEVHKVVVIDTCENIFLEVIGLQIFLGQL